MLVSGGLQAAEHTHPDLFNEVTSYLAKLKADEEKAERQRVEAAAEAERQRAEAAAADRKKQYEKNNKQQTKANKQPERDQRWQEQDPRLLGRTDDAWAHWGKSRECRNWDPID